MHAGFDIHIETYFDKTAFTLVTNINWRDLMN